MDTHSSFVLGIGTSPSGFHGLVSSVVLPLVASILVIIGIRRISRISEPG